MKDASLHVEKYLPAAAATNYSASIDLNVATAFADDWRKGYLKVKVPALANHTDSTKIILLDLQDSADDSSFANTAPLIECKIAGVASTGSVAVTFKVPIPPGIRRYIRIFATVPSGDGDNTGGLIETDWVNE